MRIPKGVVMLFERVSVGIVHAVASAASKIGKNECCISTAENTKKIISKSWAKKTYFD